MNYYNPIGVVALPQGLGFNRDSFLRHVRESNMKCAVVLDDLPLCAELGIPLPIYRSYTFEPNPVKNPKEAARNAVNHITSTPRFSEVLWQINNEPDVTQERFDMYAEMIRIIATEALPIRCVFGNFASGSVKCGQGGDSNEWLTKGESFLDILSRNPQHFIGVHEYTSYYPWYVSDGGKYMAHTTWKNRPSHLDWSLPQWHLGRNSQGIKSACDALFLLPPKVIVTEALIDRMNDVVREPNLNGYKTYLSRWAVQFPEYSLGELYSEFLIWAWETVYAKAPVPVEAVTTFCYGNTGNWGNYNVADDAAYLKGMEEYRYAPPDAPPTPPDLSNPKEMQINLPGAFVNLRSDPSVLSEVLLTVPNKATVTYFPNSLKTGWVALRYDNILGWVSLQNGAVTFKGIEVPNAETVTIEKEMIKKIIEALQIPKELLEDLYNGTT